MLLIIEIDGIYYECMLCACVRVRGHKISDNWFNKLPEACVIWESSKLIPERDGSAELDDFSEASLLTYTT